MAGDPFGLLLRQRIVFFGGEVRRRTPGGVSPVALPCLPDVPSPACRLVVPQCTSAAEPQSLPLHCDR